MADKDTPIEPLDDMAFMQRAREVLEPLSPMQRGLVLWFITTDEDPMTLGNTLDAAETIVELARALKEPDDLGSSVRWLRSKLDIGRVSVSDRDSVKARRR